jgi:hypothetical protein
MTRSTAILRLALIAAIAAVATPVARADQGFPVVTGKNEAPDAIDRYMRNHPSALLDQCDLFCRYLRNHPQGTEAVDRRSPDTRAAVRATKAQAGSHSGRVPRSYPPFRPADV